MGKSASGGSHVYDYYATILGAVCEGVVDALIQVSIDGKEIWPKAHKWATGKSYVTSPTPSVRKKNGRTWQCILAHTSDSTNAPGNPTYWTEYLLERGIADYELIDSDPKRKFKIYWGTQTALSTYFNTVSTEISEEHPPYTGVCLIELSHFWLGRERTTAPNVEVVVRKAAKQTLITGTPADLTGDGQVNLMAAAAELVTSQNCAGLDNSKLDDASWQDAADALEDRSAMVHCSPFLTEQDTLASTLDKLSEIADVYFRFNADSGLIEAGAYPHNAAPTSYHTLTADDFESAPQFKPDGWGKAKTRAIVAFNDRARLYKTTSTISNDPRAFRVLGEHRSMTLQRPWVTSEAQAMLLGADALKMDGRPQLTGSLSVRRTKGMDILPGDFVRVDIDLEPGGAGLLQFFRVTQRTIPRYGPIQLDIVAKENLSPVPIDNTPSTLTDIDTAVDDVVNARIIPTLPKMASVVDSVMILAERPSSVVTGFDAWFDVDPMGDFQRLDTVRFFAQRATLRSNHTSSATTIEVTVPAQVDVDADQDDSSLFAVQPGDLLANDDTLLAILVEMDSGDIKTGSDGYAYVEACSVVSQSIVSGSDIDITALRSRQGTQAHAFTSANAEVWLIYRSQLLELVHADFVTLRVNRSIADTPDTGSFKLQTFTRDAELELADADTISVLFPPRTQSGPVITVATPSTLAASITSPYPATTTIAATATDVDSNLVGWRILIDDHQLDEQVFSPTDSADIDYVISVSNAGTHLVKIQAFDATGLTSEVIVTITAASGTAKVATPTAWQNGRKLSLTAKGVFGPVELRCDTPGATIQWREDVFGSKGSFVTYDPADQNTWPQGRLLQHISGDDCAGWHFDVQGTKTGMTSSTVGNYTPQNVDRV